jgi:hypothetical protein
MKVLDTAIEVLLVVRPCDAVDTGSRLALMAWNAVLSIAGPTW